jgi:NAD(P)H dehydrogenase (quinone)
VAYLVRCLLLCFDCGKCPKIAASWNSFFGSRQKQKGIIVSKILVTGASGHIGKATVQHLLKKLPTSQVIAFVRDPAKASDLAQLGVEIRQGDYMEPELLLKSFAGVDKVMLTSTHAFTDRKTAQGNVLDAAVKAGVKHIVSMSIYRKKGSKVRMRDITEDDIFTEKKIADSGLKYTIAYHPPFLDVLSFYIGPAAQDTGVRVLAGDGKFAAASRDDLAAAHAAILAGNGHENKAYHLTGHPAISFEDIAGILAKLTDKKVSYSTVSEADYKAGHAAAGIPHFVSDFATDWVRHMNEGEWEEQTSDLETLLGRKPTTPTEYFRMEYLKPPVIA